MATGDLVTFANAQTYLGYASSQSTLAGLLITAISDRVKALTRRTITAADYTEYIDGHGDNIILLRQYPVNSVTNIYLDGDRAFADASALASTDYYLNEDTGIIELYSKTTAEGAKTVKVSYNAGYSTTPEDLQQAVFEALDWNMKRFEGSSIGTEMQSAGGVNIRPALTIPPSAYAVIMGYRDERC
jgi:hypothetical protein